MKRIVALLLILILWLILWYIDFFVDIGNDYIARIKFILLTSGSTVSALIIKNSVKVEINEQ
ncbi:MAG: hypothetical protein ACLR02_07475 [Clostridium sp.]|nr:hypothetical protein [Clostridium sp.]